ncbi:ATP-dependent DNA ligase [Bradyrhizobium japonicum]|uniref:ATP-dependent DNA ligase n=2 Tax=Nitrobacteraceae TaxID=41294 RepID=UPI003394096F
MDRNPTNAHVVRQWRTRHRHRRIPRTSLPCFHEHLRPYWRLWWFANDALNLVSAMGLAMRASKIRSRPYLSPMRTAFEFCLLTAAKVVPAGRDWIHEMKYDGYRLRVERQGKTVRLFTRNGHDWTKRYPLDRRGRAEEPRAAIRHRRRGCGARRRWRLGLQRPALAQA